MAEEDILNALVEMCSDKDGDVRFRSSMVLSRFTDHGPFLAVMYPTTANPSQVLCALVWCAIPSIRSFSCSRVKRGVYDWESLGCLLDLQSVVCVLHSSIIQQFTQLQVLWALRLSKLGSMIHSYGCSRAGTQICDKRAFGFCPSW
jgi:hypothetical protein